MGADSVFFRALRTSSATRVDVALPYAPFMIIRESTRLVRNGDVSRRCPCHMMIGSCGAVSTRRFRPANWSEYWLTTTTNTRTFLAMSLVQCLKDTIDEPAEIGTAPSCLLEAGKITC